MDGEVYGGAVDKETEREILDFLHNREYYDSRNKDRIIATQKEQMLEIEKEMLRYKTQLHELLKLQPEIDKTLDEYEEFLNIVYNFLDGMGVETSDIKDLNAIRVIFLNIVEAMHDLRVKCFNVV